MQSHLLKRANSGKRQAEVWLKNSEGQGVCLDPTSMQAHEHSLGRFFDASEEKMQVRCLHR